MFDSIQLTNIDTLRDLSNSFKRFGHKTEEYLQALEAELKRNLESMQARVKACQQKVAQKQWEVEQARDALENCRSYEDDDYQPDCSGEEDELRQAIREFETAKRNYETAKILYTKVENAISEFYQHIRRLRDLATTNVNRANAYLENKTAILESYRNIRSESVNPLAINSKSASPLQSDVVTNALSSVQNESSNFAANSEVESVGRIPLGFHSDTEFQTFDTKLITGLEKAGYNDVKALFQGSSVTGQSFRTGKPFDVGHLSDFDIALASPKLLTKAKALGVELRSGGTRTGPLKDAELKKLELYNIAQELSKTAGRPVHFMIFESAQSATEKGPSIPIQ